MKIDTSEPKDWNKFVKDLEVIGINKLLLTHCTIEKWDFPEVILVLEETQRPFLSFERVQDLSDVFCHYFENTHVKLMIGLKAGVDELMHKELVSRVKEVVFLEQRHGSYVGKCPFHYEETPSFIIRKNDYIFRCLSCGVGGDRNYFNKLMKEGDDAATSRRVETALHQVCSSLETFDGNRDPSKREYKDSFDFKVHTYLLNCLEAIKWHRDNHGKTFPKKLMHEPTPTHKIDEVKSRKFNILNILKEITDQESYTGSLKRLLEHHVGLSEILTELHKHFEEEFNKNFLEL